MWLHVQTLLRPPPSVRQACYDVSDPEGFLLYKQAVPAAVLHGKALFESSGNSKGNVALWKEVKAAVQLALPDKKIDHEVLTNSG